jgi:hypothetical protein
MNLSGIIFEPMVSLKMTLDEIGALESLADNHYDTTCRCLAKQGGFLYGMKNMEKILPGSDHILKEREVQLLIKLTECGNGLVDRTALTKISEFLWEVLESMHRASKAVNV